jgi:GTP-binding protein
MKITSAEFSAACHRAGDYPPPDLPEIAFAGPSNVGKSSLINALLNRKSLARTSGTPGRTQAVQFYRVNQRFFFVDLPGYGYARAPREIRRRWRRLVEGYLEDRPPLRAVVVILDARREPGKGDVDLLGYLSGRALPAILVLTKGDKLSRGQVAARRAEAARFLAHRLEKPPPGPVVFSSRTGLGRAELWRLIREHLAL